MHVLHACACILSVFLEGVGIFGGGNNVKLYACICVYLHLSACICMNVTILQQPFLQSLADVSMCKYVHICVGIACMCMYVYVCVN